MKARALMIQGTASHVGKSVLTAALCRIFKEDGISVAPFKSQNMSLNSFVTEDGREMARSQVVQAEAAGLKPDIHMNPILLKSHGDKGGQVIIHGKVYGNMPATDYHLFKREAMQFVEESYRRLASIYDLIVIEGAGSPAEINLRENDIANMGTAHMADAPVILVGDIDRGGVFAFLVGTLELLDDEDRARIKGFIINKFRGEIALLRPGLEFLERKTGLPVLGVIPYMKDIYIQEEDGVNLERNNEQQAGSNSTVRIAVIQLPHISNFTDFDPFIAEEDTSLWYVTYGQKIGEADVIIIPGTKNTLADLNYLRKCGYDEEIKRHIEKGGRVIGICGGYQMLGKRIADPYGVEGGGEAEGLGYLDIDTVFEKEKAIYQVTATPLSGHKFSALRNDIKGYEIHMGNTSYGDSAWPLFLITSRNGEDITVKDGAMAEGGRVWGTYIHGIFDNDKFRQWLIEEVRKDKGINATPLQNHRVLNYGDIREDGYKRLAEVVRTNLDMERIYEITGLRPGDAVLALQ